MAGTKRKPVSLGGGRRVPVLPPGAADATPERLRRAFDQGHEVGADEGVRRIADPFDALGQRGSLDRTDRQSNEMLLVAGRRFRAHWYGGRFDGLTALDFSRQRVDGGPGPGAATPTEAALGHRRAYARAAGAVGSRLLPYLEGIVIEARPARDLCHLVTDTGHDRTAEALVIERLREALHRLIDHWAKPGGSRPDDPAREGRE